MKKRLMRTFFSLFIIIASCASGHCDVLNFKSCQLEVKHHSAKGSEKKSIVFVNGLISHSKVFEPLIKELASKITDYKLTTLNLPPTGNSTLLKKAYNWSNMQECLNEFLETQKSPLLVLHDLSTALILPLYTSYSPKQWPAGVIILNSLVRPSEYHFHYPFTLLKNSLTGKITSQLLPIWLYKKEVVKMTINNPLLMSEDTLDEIFNSTLGNKPEAMAELIQSYPTSPRFDQKIKKGLSLPIPQLIVWGTKDPLLSNQLQFLDETTPHPKREMFILKNAKHFLMWEFAEEIAKVISQWKSKHQL